jgi:CP family cyanate transporter-like MFS transporter
MTTAPSTLTVLRAGAVVFGGVVLVGLNLRSSLTSVGPLLDEIQDGLHLSALMAAVVTTMPVVAFAGVGATTPWLVRRFAPSRLLALAMVALLTSLVLRVSTGSGLLFIAYSSIGLAGIAIANIMLPMLVKQHFPCHTGLVTGAYTMALTLGATVGAATAVPIADAFGTWRAGLAVWAVLAALAVLPWLPAALRRSRFVARRRGAGMIVRPARTGLGWAMAVYFGMNALSGYAVMGWLAQLFRDAGHSPRTAGLFLAGVTALGVPIAFFMPAIATRLRTLRPLVLLLTAASAVSYLGLALAPRGSALPVIWIALLAVGQGGFPLILAAIGLRARTPEGTVALSAFTQSIGYVMAALGPLLMGLLYAATGGWAVPMVMLAVALAAQTVAGLFIAKPRYVEDERYGVAPVAGASVLTASSTVA